MESRSNSAGWPFSRYVWGVLLIVVFLVASNFAVKQWRKSHPGSMSVLESQAMDMTVMKPTVGSVPVAVEAVHLGSFNATVTYTGSVAPLQEQVIYPRVEGWLKNLNVYNGDQVRSGQLLAVVDSPDLQSKVAEAAAGQAAAATEIPAAHYEVARMSAEANAAQGEVEAARSELARAKAMLTAAQRGVTQRQEEIKSAKANLDYWKAEIAREEKLLKSGAVSLQEYQSEQAQSVAAEAEYSNKLAMLDEAKANVAAARAEVSSKKAMISVAERRVTAASAGVSGAKQGVRQKAAMARQAGAMVATAATVDQYRYIRAPFSGTVTKRYISPGQFVTPGSAVLNVVQMDKVRLQANVSDRDINAIKVGAPVTARFAKYPNKVVSAAVTSVSPMADQASRTAIVEAIISNPGHKLVPGDSVTLDIAVSGSSDVINIPSSAVVQRDGRSAVWVVKHEAPKGKMTYYCTMHPDVTSDKPGTCHKCNMKLEPKTSDGGQKAHLMMVTTGASDGDRMEVLSGLSDGDEVIYRGHTYLKEGDTVTPTDWTSDGPRELPKALGMGSMPGMDHSKMDHSKPAAVSKKSVKGKKTYVCPMHPNITSHDPNELCRICNMKLEEKK